MKYCNEFLLQCKTQAVGVDLALLRLHLLSQVLITGQGAPVAPLNASHWEVYLEISEWMWLSGIIHYTVNIRPGKVVRYKIIE